jgi:hypothetical protein
MTSVNLEHTILRFVRAHCSWKFHVRSSCKWPRECKNESYYPKLNSSYDGHPSQTSSQKRTDFGGMARINARRHIFIKEVTHVGNRKHLPPHPPLIHRGPPRDRSFLFSLRDASLTAASDIQDPQELYTGRKKDRGLEITVVSTFRVKDRLEVRVG